MKRELSYLACLRMLPSTGVAAAAEKRRGPRYFIATEYENMPLVFRRIGPKLLISDGYSLMRDMLSYCGMSTVPSLVVRVVTGVIAPAHKAAGMKVVDVKTSNGRAYFSRRLQSILGTQRLFHRWIMSSETGFCKIRSLVA